MARAKIYTGPKNDRRELYSNAPSYEIARTSSLFGQAFAIYIKGFELSLASKHLTFSQWSVLSILLASPRPVNAMQFKRFLSIEAPTVSQLLNKLEKRNLILRKHSKKDKRTIDVYLTEQGYQLLKETMPIIAERLNKSFGSLSKTRREQLDSLTEQVRNNCLKSFGIDPVEADNLLKMLITLGSNRVEVDDDFWEKP
jgi:DNA-binding MarR family transcriptional regulator